MKLKKILAVAALLAIGGGSNAWAQWTDITNGNSLTYSTKEGFANEGVKHDQVVEIWTNNASAAFDLNQTVATIPAGVYELSANAMYRASLTYGTATNCVLYANINGTEFTAPIKNYGDATTKEDGKAIGQAMVNHDSYGTKIPLIFVEVDATNATIGMKNTGDLTYCTNGYWFMYNKASFSFKNVTADVFTKLKTQAESLVASAQNGDAKTALQDAVSTNTEASVASVKALKNAIDTYLWAAASEENPISVTSNIENPSFEGGQRTFWYQDFGYTQPSPASSMAQPNGWDLIYSGAKVGNSKFQSFTTQTSGAKDGNCLYVRHRWGDVNAVEDLRQSVHNLPAGKYRLTVAVKGDKSVTDANTLTLTAGANTNTTTISNFNKTAYQDYSVEVLKDDDASTLDICYGFKQTSGNEQLYYVDDFRLYFLGNAKYATEEDYTNLNTAIAAAEAKTLGFQEGEYAPYNNIAAINTLKEAKAIDQNANNDQQTVLAAINALNTTTWTVNADEVNAIYNGTFAASTDEGAPAGWEGSDNELGGALHARAFVLTSGGNYDNLAAFNQGDTRSAFYIRFDGTNSSTGTWYNYGKTEGYTMPLKAGVTYKLRFQGGAWGDYANKELSVAIKNEEGTIASGKLKTTKKTNNGQGVDNFELTFKPGVDGNYTIGLWNNNNNSNYAAIVSNFTLFSASDEELLQDAKTAAIASLPSAGDGIFTPSATDIADWTTAINDATTLAEVQEAVTATVGEWVAPATLGYWHLKNTAAEQVYMGTNDGNVVLSETPVSLTFERVGDTYTYNIKYGQKYINMKGDDNWSMSADATAETAWTFTLADGKYTVTGPNGLIGSDATEVGSYLYGNKAANNNGKWDLWSDKNTATMTLTSAHAATFIAPFDIAEEEIPEGVSVWALYEIEQNGEVLAKFTETNEIVANTPYMLYRYKDVTLNKTFHKESVADQEEYNTDYFVGTLVKKEAPVGSFILQRHDIDATHYEVAYYQVQNGGLYVGKNRCYMAAGTPCGWAGVRGFIGISFDDMMETAVENIKAEAEAKAEIYDLNGRRVQKATKGLYIINGKKVIK